MDNDSSLMQDLMKDTDPVQVFANILFSIILALCFVAFLKLISTDDGSYPPSITHEELCRTLEGEDYTVHPWNRQSYTVSCSKENTHD